MAIVDNVNVNIFDGSRPLDIPNLSKTLILDPTQGKSFAGSYRDYVSQNEVEGDYDVDDPAAVASNTYYSQDNPPQELAIVNIDRTDFRRATGTTGTAASNTEIQYTAEGYGDRGTDITVEIVDNSSNDDDETITVTREETFNSEIDASTSHTADQYVALAIEDPGENNFDLTVTPSTTRSITGTKRVVTVKPDTDNTGTITSTIQEVVDAVNGDTDASKIMSLSVNSGATASNPVSTLAEDNIDTTITIEAADDGSITSTANDVVDAVNGDATAAAAITASLSGTNNDGTGTVSAASTGLTLASSKSPSELSRAMTAIKNWEKRRGLEETYFLNCTSHDSSRADGIDGDRAELGDWVSARRMVYLTSSSPDESAEAINDLAATMSTDRAVIFAHTDEDQYPESGLSGIWGSWAPGGGTLMYQEVKTFTEADYSTSEINLIQGGAPGDNGAGTMQEAFGVDVTDFSWATDGSFADLRRQKDWLEVWIQASLLNLFIDENKVGFDAPGFNKIESVLHDVCQQAGDQRIVATKVGGGYAYEITMPEPLDVPQLNRENRDFKNPGPRIDLRFAGSVEKITINVFTTA